MTSTTKCFPIFIGKNESKKTDSISIQCSKEFCYFVAEPNRLDKVYFVWIDEASKVDDVISSTEQRTQ